MAKKYYPKPRLVERWTVTPKGPNTECQKTLYDNAQPYICEAPTVDGKTYCADCARKTLTLTDRAPLPDQPAPKPFHWNTDQILPRKRA